ncbi:unnamed protein product [Onchocerca flexuosa]|uniref:Uncharacterized protein n=1 Tax=Onchocerca flexuosa TaxID=387005 RepID=A0A183H7V1_9BILA|nr:unnamed protein product [Onchocerca flexuosa]
MKQRERRFAHHTDGLTMISWFDAIGLVNRFHGSGGTGQMGGCLNCFVCGDISVHLSITVVGFVAEDM